MSIRSGAYTIGSSIMDQGFSLQDAGMHSNAAYGILN